MQGQYRVSKESKRSRFYILLSIIFVIVMFKWGLPLMINAISGPERKRVSISENDFIPPQQPRISALPDATNSARIVVEGFTEAGADVEFFVNDVSADSEKADVNGFFSFDGLLEPGDNRLGITAKDSSGNTSQSPIVIISFDNKPVSLTLESPSDGSEHFGSSNQTIEVTGKVSKPDTEVLVNNSFASVDNNGKFSYRLNLAEGENVIKVIATDKAGNNSQKEIKVIFHQ